jgi:hypothetical protein
MCVACGAEMHLVRVAGDETIMLLGDEHHTFECSACREIERRLIFTRAKDFSAAVSFELATTPRKPHTLPKTRSLVWLSCATKIATGYGNSVTGSDGGWWTTEREI